MEYINFPENLKSIKKYQKMLGQMKKEVISFAESFNDDPAKLSEWGHYYFCDDDGGRLIFDLNKPKTHVCEICGKSFNNKIFDGVWIYMYRNEAIKTIWKSALLYRVYKKKKYLDIVLKLTNFYVDNYLEFPIHNKEHEIFNTIKEAKWGCGRILPQGLNEAIIMVRLVNALELIKGNLSSEYLEKLHNNLFKEVFKLLKPQVDKIHNIRCWMNSAIGIMGLFSNDKEMINFAFDGEYNIKKQLSKGVTNDYFWFEGSIHYNFFTLEGVMNLALFTKLYNYKEFNNELIILKKMLIAAYNYAFDNQVFPNPNDGWPNINLKTYSYIYHLANKVFEDDLDITNLLKNIECNPLERGTLPLSKPYYYQNKISLEELIFNNHLDLTSSIPIKRESKNSQSSHYGILRNSLLNVFLKYGHNSKSHAHPDKMNIEVMIGNYLLTKDLSNAGYRAKLFNEWHRVSASHNTVVVDGENHQSYTGGKTLTESNNHLEAMAYDVYNGVDFVRKISISSQGFYDKFSIYSKNHHTYDFIFHLEENVKIISKFQTEPFDLKYKTNGYQYFNNMRKIITHKDNLEIKMKLKEYSIVCNITLNNQIVLIGTSPDNPVNKTRTTIIIRYYGKNTNYILNWDIKKEGNNGKS